MRLSRSLAVVWLLILAYGIFFSALSIERHRAFLTHASDLGQIDQAIWNTLQGRLLEQTKATGVQNVRLSDHVEPIFVPLSLAFLVYDNVEALLIVQSFAIALGALAVFWIARKRFAWIGATHLAEGHGVADTNVRRTSMPTGQPSDSPRFIYSSPHWRRRTWRNFTP